MLRRIGKSLEAAARKVARFGRHRVYGTARGNSDLLANPEVKTFLKRSEIIREIRNFLGERGFVEVETPMMQAIPGGAAAQPFKTHHNALGCDFYLRIALELYLKRLLVGGMDRVYEIGRNFRNEGLSRKHNPEFTMLEAYEAYGNYETMMELVQSMVCHVAQKVLGRLVIEHKDRDGKITRTIDLTPPWRRIKYKDIIRERTSADWFALSANERRNRAIDADVLARSLQTLKSLRRFLKK